MATLPGSQGHLWSERRMTVAGLVSFSRSDFPFAMAISRPIRRRYNRLWSIELLGTVLVGAGLASRDLRIQQGIIALAAGLGLGAIALSKVRAREVVLWITVLFGVLNFAGFLFQPANVADAAVWTKVIKDLPLVLLLGTAALLPPVRWKPAGLETFETLFLVWAAVLIALGLAIPTWTSGFLASARYYIAYPLLVLVVLRFDLSPEEISRTLRLIVLLGAMEGIIAVAEFSGHLKPTYYQNYVALGDRTGSYPRAIGTLGNPNNLGLFLGLPALLLLVPLWRSPRRLFGLTWSLPLLLLVLTGITLSFSRSAAVALAIALVWTLGSIGRRARMLVLVSLMVILGWLTFAGRSQSEISILGTRAQTQQQAFESWISSPRALVFGQGVGADQIVSSSHLVRGPAIDSMILQLLLEGGLVAFAAFALLVGSGLQLLRRAWRALPDDPVIMGLLAYTIFFICYSPVAVNFRLFPGAMLFWLAIGLGATLWARRAQAEVSGERRDFRRRDFPP